MDNLTHTLIGAVLGRAGLKRLSGLAMPTLMIAANLPDIDAGCTVYGIESLAMRRGITHGPPALVILPALLTGAMIWFDRWQTRRGTRPVERLPVRPGWLLLLAFIGCLTHPAFDWLNSYGIRLLAPFSHQWFYGDGVFIIDWVLWLGLGGALWLSRRHEREGRNWTRAPRIAAIGTAGYVLANVGVSAAVAEAAWRAEPYPAVAVANPVPLAFWRREVLVGGHNAWQQRTWSPAGGFGPVVPVTRARGCAWPGRAMLESTGAEARAFLFWSRLPFAEAGEGGRLRLRDARFAGRGAGRFAVQTALPCLTRQPGR